MLKYAIVRPPGRNFAEGLTTAGLGVPDHRKALQQHERYCEALLRCGLELIRLDADLRYPDSTFVEDTAILTARCAILARPGASTRAGEVDEIRIVLAVHYPSVHEIAEGGTLDGGDICDADRHFFIGISRRTNAQGAGQLAGFLAQEGISSTFVDIRGVEGLLHLKSGMAYLGENRLAVIGALADREEFLGYDIIRIAPAENYATNCLRVNDCFLIASGFPTFEESLEALGHPVIALEMSEFQKMDGGLSCLSLRF